MSLKYDIIQGKLLRDLLFSFIYDLIIPELMMIR